MIKKEVAYKTSDGKLFTGKNAERSAKIHETHLETKNLDELLVETARRLFNVPVQDETNIHMEDSDYTQDERAFIDFVIDCDYLTDFSDLIKAVRRMHTYNPIAFDQLVTKIKKNSERTR